MSDFAGKIELDIRDSVPDWAPYLAPKAPDGAPNVVFIVWGDVGLGTATLYVDGDAVGSSEIVTQPGWFGGVGDGLCVGRDDASPVTPAYTAPSRFTGGTIDKVVVDVSGERYRDHEAEVRGWFILD